MSEFANFQFPLFNMGGVREDIVAPMPTVRVIGKWAGTPEGVAVLKQFGPEISQRVTALRQHYYTGVLPMVRKFITMPAYDMEYVMHEGKELVTLKPKARFARKEEPSGPCRFILIEHTYLTDVKVEVLPIPAFWPYSSELGGAIIDGHSGLFRHELRTGKFRRKHVGTGLGEGLSGENVIPDWAAFRNTVEDYLNVHPYAYDLYDLEERQWPPVWRHDYTISFITPASVQEMQRLAPRTGGRLPEYDNDGDFEVTGDPPGVYHAKYITTHIAVVDVYKLARVAEDNMLLQVSGFWSALNVHSANEQGVNVEGYEYVRQRVGTPTPHPVQTAITRVWMSSEKEHVARGSDNERLSHLIVGSPFEVYGIVARKAQRDALGISMESVAFTQTLSAHQTEVPPNPYYGPYTAYGSPPTVLPWGEDLMTVRYNVTTGEFSVTVPEHATPVPVDMSL